jgi:hypothetical protein
MKDFSVDHITAIVGIDWADEKHDTCDLPAGFPRVSEGTRTFRHCG